MRIFVVGTGRCGSVTFTRACAHITNFTAAHEEHRGVAPFRFRDNHIAIDAALVPFIPIIRANYPDAKWIHLWREEEPCVKSIATRKSQNFFSALYLRAPRTDEMQVARIYYQATNKLVEALCPDALTVKMDNMKSGDWLKVWQFIGAKGDYDKSLAEWNNRYNSTKQRK